MAKNMQGGAKKSLGQNYLVNERAALGIVESLGLEEGELVFEIGPGRGALTRHLASSAALVTAFEIDAVLCRELRKSFAGAENVEIVRADILRVDLEREAAERDSEKYKVIGNIPYMLTSGILIRLPSLRRSRLSVIMVQKEVAERILTPAGERNCGLMTVFLRSYLKVERVMKVSAGCFSPRPDVDSAVLRFSPVSLEGAPADRSGFFAFIKRAFSTRRKQLKNSLFPAGAEKRRIMAERMEDLSGVDLRRRAENLLLAEWFALYESYLKTAGGHETD